MNRPRTIPTLTSPRLALRPFGDSDVVELVALLADRSIADGVLHLPYPYTESDARDWIGTHAAGCAAGASLHWAIQLRDPLGSIGPPRLIGAIGLSLSGTHERGELGYWIGVAHQGRGHASEAARTVVDHAFERLGLHRVTAHHMAWNVGSGRVLEKAGLRREGVLREHILKNGRFVDAVLYGALRADRAASS